MGMRFSIELSDKDLGYFRKALKKSRDAVRHADEAEIIEAIDQVLDDIKSEKPLRSWKRYKSSPARLAGHHDPRIIRHHIQRAEALLLAAALANETSRVRVHRRDLKTVAQSQTAMQGTVHMVHRR